MTIILGNLINKLSTLFRKSQTHEVDIILCARHTQGITKQIVQDIANKYNYEELDFTHMYPKDFNWSSPAVGISNSILSQAIYDILISL